MRKPAPRTALISLATAITVSAVATFVLQSAAFPTRDDPKAKEAYAQGYAWVKSRTEPSPSPSPSSLSPSPSPSKTRQPQLGMATDRAVQTLSVTITARAVRTSGEADHREICGSFASTPEYTRGLRPKYRDDWIRGCQAALGRAS